MNMRLISIIFILSTVLTPTIAFESETQEVLLDINDNASRLTYKLDEQGMGHFTYLTGVTPEFEPSGEDTDLETSKHKMYYGTYDIDTGDVKTEKVTDAFVFPYHYNFQIDSLGQIHTTYVSNYTLYYAVRNTQGDWETNPINDRLNWYAYQPDIVLGNNDEPRIIYVASYKDGAAAYFGHMVHTAYRAVHYTLKNSTGWFLYDISMNTDFSSNKSPGRFLVYNPALLIEDGIVYVSYNVDSALAASSNLEFLRFSEYPDDENSEKSFDEFKFPKIYENSVRATKLRRPQIFTLDGGIVLLVGTWTAGGGLIAYLNDKSLSPIISNSASASDQWEIFQIENDRRSLQIESFTGAVDKDHKRIIGVYSTFHLYDSGRGAFNRDVLAIAFSLSDGSIEPVEYFRITDTDSIHHTYPNVNVLDNNEIKVNWLTWKNGSSPQLVQASSDLSVLSLEDSDDDGTEVLLFLNSEMIYVGVVTVVLIYRRRR